jgi:ATP-dependent Clp protease ATP-binding subunit ClpB
MDLTKFTERSRGFIQAAQTIAMREGHQRLVPEHVLKALLDDAEGIRSGGLRLPVEPNQSKDYAAAWNEA